MTNAPWWCMYADHAPYDKESEYVAHMLQVHGIDYANGQIRLTATRAWQCGDASHSLWSNEQLFLEHLVSEHGLSLKVSPT